MRPRSYRATDGGLHSPRHLVGMVSCPAHILGQYKTSPSPFSSVDSLALFTSYPDDDPRTEFVSSLLLVLNPLTFTDTAGERYQDELDFSGPSYRDCRIRRRLRVQVRASPRRGFASLHLELNPVVCSSVQLYCVASAISRPRLPLQCIPPNIPNLSHARSPARLPLRDNSRP